jgi:hypothetical protein
VTNPERSRTPIRGTSAYGPRPPGTACSDDGFEEASQPPRAAAGACPRSPHQRHRAKETNRAMQATFREPRGGIRVSSPSHADWLNLLAEDAPESLQLIKPTCPGPMACGHVVPNRPTHPQSRTGQGRTRLQNCFRRLPAFWCHGVETVTPSIGLLTMTGGLDDPPPFAKWAN